MGALQGAGTEDERFDPRLEKEVAVRVRAEGVAVQGEAELRIDRLQAGRQRIVRSQGVAAGGEIEGHFQIEVGNIVGGAGGPLADRLGDGVRVRLRRQMQVDPAFAAVGDDKPRPGRAHLPDRVDDAGGLPGKDRVASQMEQHPQHRLHGVVPQFRQRGVNASTTGDETRLQIAVVGKTGGQRGRLADHHPGRTVLFEKGHAAVPVLLLPHHQQQPRRRAFGGRQRRQGQPGFEHGGTPPLHVGAAQAADHPVLFAWTADLQIPGGDGVDMPHQVELWFRLPHGHPQVVAILFNLLAFDGEAGADEAFLQVELDVFFLAGGRIDIKQVKQGAAQPLRIDLPPDSFQSLVHGDFSATLRLGRVRFRVM